MTSCIEKVCQSRDQIPCTCYGSWMSFSKIFEMSDDVAAWYNNVLHSWYIFNLNRKWNTNILTKYLADVILLEMQFMRLWPLTRLRQAPFFKLIWLLLCCKYLWSVIYNGHDVLLRKLWMSLRKTTTFHKEWTETWFPHVFVHKTRHMYTSAMARGAQHVCA